MNEHKPSEQVAEYEKNHRKGGVFVLGDKTTSEGYATAALYRSDDKTRVENAPRIAFPFPPTVEWGGALFRLKEGHGGKGSRGARYVEEFESSPFVRELVSTLKEK